EEDDDDDEDDDDNDGNDDGDDSDGNDDDDNDGNDDDDSDHEMTKSDKDKNSQSNEEHEEEEEEYVDEFTNKEDDVDNTKEENEEELDDAEELYKDKTESLMQSSSVSSDFTEKLLNFENVSPVDNEIASLMDTIVHHEEPSGQTSSLYTIPVTAIPKITSAFTTTIPPPPPSFNPLLQQATPTPTPTASEVTTSFPALPNFASVFRFNDRVTNLERYLSEMKQVDQYAQAISSIPAISYIKEEANTQLPQTLPQAVSEFATPVIERNIIESLEAAILAKSSSQPKSTYKAVASPFEFELTKILMDKIEEHKSYLSANYKKELYDALVKSYNTDKDLFDTYGDFSPSQMWISNIARAENPPTLFDELMDTPIDFSVFVMNRLNITNTTQELLVRPAFNLLKGTCKS
ncbi:hypothetical protein Tco_1171110, partial [Tanacetum coccineum]